MTACVVAPSRKVERLLRDYHVQCRIEVIPTGVDLRVYRQAPDPGRMAALRTRWAVPEDKTVLLYLGRMAKEKNLEQLIDQIASHKRKDIVLLLVGDGPDREEVLEYARGRNVEVIFTGMVPHSEVPDYYRLGDLFVTASTSETQGLTYFEALAAGVPVLCRRDPCVEGVVEDGVNGWQYDSGEDFGRYLSEFCDSAGLRRQMSEAAKRSSEKFSAEAFGKSAERLYQSVARSAMVYAS